MPYLPTTYIFIIDIHPGDDRRIYILGSHITNVVPVHQPLHHLVSCAVELQSGSRVELGGGCPDQDGPQSSASSVGKSGLTSTSRRVDNLRCGACEIASKAENKVGFSALLPNNVSVPLVGSLGGRLT